MGPQEEVLSNIADIELPERWSIGQKARFVNTQLFYEKLNQIAIINITTILAAASTKGYTTHKQSIIDDAEDCMRDFYATMRFKNLNF